MALRRFERWPELLAAFLAQHQHTPFEWGRCDCALLACDAIHVMTGVDPAEAFRYQYSSALGAAKKIKNYLRERDAEAKDGLEALAASIAAEHAMAEIPAAFARRGDVLLFDGHTAEQSQDAVELFFSFGATLGIVSLDGVEGLFTGKAGLLPLPVKACRRAWRVG